MAPELLTLGTIPRLECTSAPSYIVPAECIVSVEHPCIVKHVDKGIKSLGGEHQVKILVEGRTGDDAEGKNKEIRVGVKLRPDDPFSNQILSKAVGTRNVLVKVTVPKRTGRKRRRGSDQPFAHPEDGDTCMPPTAQDILQRLRDRPDSYAIETLGVLNKTHRFRSLPDFQLRGSDVPIMNDICQTILPATLESVKEFRIDTTPGSEGITAFPAAPTYTEHKIPRQPFTYEYNQAQGVRLIIGRKGELTSENKSLPKRRLQQFTQDADVSEIPQERPPFPEGLDCLSNGVKKAIDRLTKLLDQRPLVTTRVAMNAIPEFANSDFKAAAQFAGYAFKAGPFRDSLIKFGIDPRKDPKFRFYQTLLFHVSDKINLAKEAGTVGSNKQWLCAERGRSDEVDSHIFDGNSLTLDGKIWQMCDITDPILRALIDTDELQPECDVGSNGWFYNGTVTKIRVIMREKICAMITGKSPKEDEDTYERISRMPNHIGKPGAEGAYFDPGEVSEKVTRLAGEVRMIARGSTRSAKWLSNKSLLQTGGEEQRAESEVDEEEMENEQREDEDSRGDFAFAEDIVFDQDEDGDEGDEQDVDLEE